MRYSRTNSMGVHNYKITLYLYDTRVRAHACVEELSYDHREQFRVSQSIDYCAALLLTNRTSSQKL